MIVITTPTGNIGHRVLNSVVASGEAVRAIVRDPAKLSAHLRSRVQILEGSHGEPQTVDRAFDGADSLFWVVPPDFRATSLKQMYEDFTRPAANAVKKYGVQRIVVVSALGRGWPRDTGLIAGSLRMDDLMESTGVHCRVLTCPGFMDNLLRQLQPIRGQGMFFGTLDPDRKDPYCATSDIAASATKWLLDRSWSGQEDVPVLGPEDLSSYGMAEILSEVLGKAVRYQQISLDALGSQLSEQGATEAVVQGYLAMMAEKNRGLDHVVARTPENSTPTSFRQWCEHELKPAILK